jgi:hypothetical protein
LTVEHLDGVALLCSKLEEKHLEQIQSIGGNKTVASTGWRIYVEAHNHFDAKKADALFKKFVKNGTWHVPTLVQIQQMARLADAEPIPAEVEKEIPALLKSFWKREVTADVWVRLDRLKLDAGSPVLKLDLANDADRAGESSSGFKKAEPLKFAMPGE